MVNADITSRPLPYEGQLQSRMRGDIELVVIHCTELPDLAEAREYGEQIHYPQSGTGNSGHFYIDRDGRVEQWVDPLQIAHHVANMNRNSIGIELVNQGRYPSWYDSRHQQPDEHYPQIQIAALAALLKQLTKTFPNLGQIAGHQDLDTRKIPSEDDAAILIQRKIDPGPHFPWQEVLAGTTLKRVNANG